MFILLNTITYSLCYNQILPFITTRFIRLFVLCHKENPKWWRSLRSAFRASSHYQFPSMALSVKEKYCSNSPYAISFAQTAVTIMTSSSEWEKHRKRASFCLPVSFIPLSSSHVETWLKESNFIHYHVVYPFTYTVCQSHVIQLRRKNFINIKQKTHHILNNRVRGPNG